MVFDVRTDIWSDLSTIQQALVPKTVSNCGDFFTLKLFLHNLFCSPQMYNISHTTKLYNISHTNRFSVLPKTIPFFKVIHVSYVKNAIFIM